MRLLVRLGVRITIFPWVFTDRRQRIAHIYADVLFQLLSPTSGQSNSRGKALLNSKENAPRGCFLCPQVRLCCHTVSTSQLRNFNPIPFRKTRQSLLSRSYPFPQGRLTHVQLLFTWNPSPLQSSKFSFEYLLLPPRSALEIIQRRLTPRSSSQFPRPPTHCDTQVAQWSNIGTTLQRYPFSGLVHSAGELLHTPQRISTSMTTVLLFK